MVASIFGLITGFLQPVYASTQKDETLPIVYINEVAAGGTRASTADKWIELYYPDDGAQDYIDLADWTLVIKTINPQVINLSGRIDRGGYFLLEQTAAATNKTANLISPEINVLNTEGIEIELMDNNNESVDTANKDGTNWVESDQPDFCSMERIPKQPDAAQSWKKSTAIDVAIDENGAAICGTPGRANTTTAFTPTPTVTLTGTATSTATATATNTVTPTPTAKPSSFPIRSVIINEVAWMGTKASYNDEWIELYNPGSQSVNLSGWKLKANAGSFGLFEIELVGFIPAKGYFLLERLNDYVIKDIPANQIYTERTLNDFGEYLYLLAPNDATIDTSNKQNGAWPAGKIYPYYCSMERAGSNVDDLPRYWITNSGDTNYIKGRDALGNRICGSPKSLNFGYSVTATPVPPTPTPYHYSTPTPIRTSTPTRTPKKSPTPTRNPNITPQSNVVINEFLPQPRTDWNGDSLINKGDEFIELINLGTLPALLTGWKLDDKEGDSAPFTIGAVTLAPQGHMTFFTSLTGILLSTGGDSVRLFRPNGQISDAFTYDVIRNPDQSWCRLPDGGPKWVFGCGPTIDSANKLPESVIVGNRLESAICISKKLPTVLNLAECDDLGLYAWDSGLWGYQTNYPLFFSTGRDVYILD